MSYHPISKRLFTERIVETNQSSDLRAHSELAGLSDGTKWEELGSNALSVANEFSTAIVFKGKMWLIGGYTSAFSATRKVFSSTDGVTWTEAGVDALPSARYYHSSVVFNGKMWVIGGADAADVRSRKVFYSNDGVTWTEAGVDALPVATYRHTSVVYKGRMWVIAGREAATTRKVYYSTDGIRWTEAGVDALPVATYWHGSVVFNDRMWVIGGYTGAATRKVYYSTDGIAWTEAGVDALPVAQYVQRGCVVYAGKMWVVGGGSGAYFATVYFSPDGITWTQAGVNALPTVIGNHSVIVYQGRIISIGGWDNVFMSRHVYATVPQQSGLVIDGPQTHRRTPTAISVAVGASDYYIGCTAGGITISLPAVAGQTGRVLTIKDESGAAAGANITVQASGAETIDGSNTYLLTSNYQSLTIVCTGTSWKVV